MLIIASPNNLLKLVAFDFQDQKQLIKIYCTNFILLYLTLYMSSRYLNILNNVTIDLSCRQIVTSHITWEWGCAYMYKHIIFDTMRFKVVMSMNLLELHS